MKSSHKAASNGCLPPVEQPKPVQRPRIGGGIRVLDGKSSSGVGLSRIPRYGHSSSHQATQRDASPVPLYKRLLYSNLGPGEAPPRILETPGTEDIDAQLYTLLALIFRGFISPWYSKISRDRAFALEIVRVASHVFRELERRLVHVNIAVDGRAKADEENRDGQDEHYSSIGPSDLDPRNIDKIRLLTSTIPKILELHIRDYRTAQQRCRSAYSAYASGTSDSTEMEVLFHSLQPHIAVKLKTQAHQASETGFATPEDQTLNERLPAYLDADYIRAAVEAILEELLPPEDFGAETERSVIREVIAGIVLEGVFRKVTQPWFIHNIIGKTLEGRMKPIKASSPVSASFKIDQDWYSRIAGYIAALPVIFYQITAVFGYLSWLLTTSFASSHYRRYRSRPNSCSDLLRPSLILVKAALVGHGPRDLISQLAMTAMNVGTVASPISDRILVHYLYTRIFTASTTLALLRTVEEALFPEGYPAPAVPDPDEAEQAFLKERAVKALASMMPKDAGFLFEPRRDGQSRERIAEELLEPFSNAIVNTHLYLMILDTVVANLCPDLVVTV